jgi:hypothetical protein
MPNTHVPAAGEAMPAAHPAFALPPETATAGRTEAVAHFGARTAADIETAPAATPANEIDRRLFLRSVPAALAVGAVITAPAVAEEFQTVATPIKAWSDFVASFADLVPDGARVQIFGSSNSCRAVLLQTFMEPVRPGRLDRMFPVEWIVASYRLTPEGLYPDFSRRGRSADDMRLGPVPAHVRLHGEDPV